MSRSLTPIFAALAVLLALIAGVVLAAPGDHLPAGDFNLTAANDTPAGITHAASHFYILDFDDNVYKYTNGGSYVSSFPLHSGNSSPQGIAYDGVNLLVVDANTGQNKVYKYTTTGAYVSNVGLVGGTVQPKGIAYDGTHWRISASLGANLDQVRRYTTGGAFVDQFPFSDSNDDGRGLTYDGTHLRVVDSDDNVYKYTLQGDYIDKFSLHSGNSNPYGITYDGVHIRVVDNSADKVFSYEHGSVSLNSDGVRDDDEYAAIFKSTVSTIDLWKCASKSAAETERLNNAELSLFGFCVRTVGSGVEVELHMATDTTPGELTQFSRLTAGTWWIIETGSNAARLDSRIYDDDATATTSVAFGEEASSLVPSTRFGSSTPTLSKTVSDADCSEDMDKSGFACNTTAVDGLASGESAALLISLSDVNKLDFADVPHVPESLTVSRDAAYTTATLGWALVDAVSEYEVERTAAVRVSVGEDTFIEYGDPVLYMVAGTQAGIAEYADASIQSHRTYQYRIRARGGDPNEWSEWSPYISSGAEPSADVAAPLNIELTRGESSVAVSWTAPPGDLDGFTVQRQELITDEDDNSFFANPTSLTDDWIASSTTEYIDSTITADRIYEYRVAAVVEDQVGAYSDWFRSGGSAAGTFGQAPPNLRLVETTSRIFDERFLFWMEWDPVTNAADYEIETVSYALNSGDGTSDTRYVSTSTAFFTIYNRVESRVRARDDSGAQSEWTAWFPVRFTPRITVPAPEMVDEGSSSTTTAELREDMEDLITVVLEPLGGEVNAPVVLEFGVLVAGMILGAVTIGVAWARGMAPLGAGMACGIFGLVLFTGWRLFDTSLAWPLAFEVLVVPPGFYAAYQKFGVFGR